MDNNDESVKYSSYTDAQKRATQKYRSNNKDKVNEQRKKYYQHRKEADPNFLEYKRQKAREYYQKKKGLTSQEPDVEQVADPVEEHTITQVDELVETISSSMIEPVIEVPVSEVPLPPPALDPDYIEVTEVPPKRTRKPRAKKAITDNNKLTYDA